MELFVSGRVVVDGEKVYLWYGVPLRPVFELPFFDDFSSGLVNWDTS